MGWYKPKEIIVHQNEWYSVFHSDKSGYCIKNNKTGMVEGVAELLPSAISKSDAWNELMIESKGNSL